MYFFSETVTVFVDTLQEMKPIINAERVELEEGEIP